LGSGLVTAAFRVKYAIRSSIFFQNGKRWQELGQEPEICRRNTFRRTLEIVQILQNVIIVPYSRRPKEFESRTTSVNSDAAFSVRLLEMFSFFLRISEMLQLTSVAGMWQACHWLPGTWPTATSRETLCQLTLKIDMMSIKFLVRTGRDCTFATSIQYCVCFRFFRCFRCFR
jgi:hypothetical protein